ncbi:T9SS type B sorting domain-containing protein [Flavobacterium channae]|uniref:T9SS type B sorting domain-containing protein n=1 Tax=Flavobacterium channae TaxID=2897181 RepID=UPI001E57FEC8|nr:gliding motility-associated C-terminal domain-containing protein [Flavobacterium channae]UGS24801.1 gliding motility-associated C-terminal domain-containing protein [Flavobacterium channae]
MTFTATDDCGNSTSSTATFTIQDTTAPVISIQASNMTVECDGSGNTADLNAWLASNGGASASDACSSVTWSNNFSSLSDACGATGTASVTFTATDDCGNSTSSTATFTIQDTTTPVISIQAANMTVECDGNGNTADLNAWLASNGGSAASDACSSVTWSNNFTSLSDACGASGTASVTFTATDDCGNSTSSTATFTIQDTTAPVISIQAANMTVECDGNGNTDDLNAWLASNGGSAASDACSSVTWSNNFSSLSDACGATGTASVTFTATDDCGNSTSSTATFTIQDTTAPVISIQAANMTVECDGNGNTADLNAWLASNGGASASDACSSVTWSNLVVSSISTGCPNTEYTAEFIATDECGNSTSTTASFFIQDTTTPVFTSELPANVSVSCDNIPIAANMSGSDNCDNEVSISVVDTIDNENSSCEGEYIIYRTWTITDDCNNNTSYTQTITVFDNTPPVLTTPISSEINVSCSEIPAVPQLGFTDNCSGIHDVVYNETSTIVSIYEYIIIREWTVSDNCGNEANFTQTINVRVDEPFDAIPYAICVEEDPIDLFTILDDSIPTTGTWSEVTSSGGLSGSIFDPSNVTLGYYTLQYVVELEDNSCPMIYEVYLNVNDDCVVLAACEITVYNAVSPNNDNSNDFFFIDGLECYPNNTVEIYNRWGILVYDTTGYDNGLKSFKGVSEGRSTVSKNELLPDGTYFYILKYTDEENKSHDKSGYLYLNR